VVFTIFDHGGGVIVFAVTNFLPYAVDAFLNWSWAGVNGLSSKILDHSATATLEANLPPGFDATFEIGAKQI
jgi:hypothetical protein